VIKKQPESIIKKKKTTNLAIKAPKPQEATKKATKTVHSKAKTTKNENNEKRQAQTKFLEIVDTPSRNLRSKHKQTQQAGFLAFHSLVSWVAIGFVIRHLCVILALNVYVCFVYVLQCTTSTLKYRMSDYE
jgi:hypothetical protein